MISIIIASKNQKDLERCKQSIKQTIGVPYEVIVTENADGAVGLAEVYNRNAKKAKYNFLLFLHEDTEFKTNNWGVMLVNLLRKDDVGVIGIAGSTYMAANGSWISPKVPFIKGRIVHACERDNTKEQVELFSEEEGNFEVVVLDGVFLAAKKSIVEEIPFDEETFTKFHFYDIDFSLRVARKYKVMVTTDILLKHYSGGGYDEQWWFFRERFLRKHKEMLPFTKGKEVPDWKRQVRWKVKYL